MKIELLYILDCPWCVRTKSLLKKALQDAGDAPRTAHPTLLELRTAGSVFALRFKIPSNIEKNLTVKEKMNKKLKAIEKLLKLEGESDEKINATLEFVKEKEKNEKLNSLRSWIAVITSIVALVVSILVAIHK